jgi:hypothetical protein
VPLQVCFPVSQHARVAPSVVHVSPTPSVRRITLVFPAEPLEFPKGSLPVPLIPDALPPLLPLPPPEQPATKSRTNQRNFVIAPSSFHPHAAQGQTSL